MKILRSVNIGGGECEILISDDDVALREANASLKATIAILKGANISVSSSKYAVEDVNDIDEEYLRLVACRYLHLPVIIGETDRLTVRETVSDDWEKLTGLKELPFKTAQELAVYTPQHYDLFGYGLYVLELKEGIIGIAGFYNKDGRCFISYEIKEGYRSQGYAHEGCEYLLRYLYNRTGISEVYAEIRSDNAVSVKLAKKLGVQPQLIPCSPRL